MDYVELFWNIHDAVQTCNNRQVLEHMLSYRSCGPHYPGERWWWVSQTIEHEPHPAILFMLERGYRADDMHRLVLEWPHVAMKDATRLAYTQSVEKGKRGLQTVTSIGKYLHRHFSAVPDHVIRDVAELSAAGGTYELLWEMGQMLDIITNDEVHSCMSDLEVPSRYHAYNAYNPAYGWGLAVRIGLDGELQARALVNRNEHCYVRSYTRGTGDDLRLEAWLEKQGYEKYDAWPAGLKLAKIIYGDDLVAPYLDGNNTYVKDEGEYLRITKFDDGIQLQSSSGLVEYKSTSCENCGAYCREGDLVPVDRDGDYGACDGCISGFTAVRGRNGYRGYREYYLHDDDDRVVWSVNDTAYDAEYLPDDMVLITKGTDEGKVCKVDSAVQDLDDEWWHESDIVNDVADSGIIELTAGQHEGSYCDTDYTFMCLYDGKVYHDDDGCVSVDGGFVAEANHAAWLKDQGEEDQGEEEPGESPFDSISQETVHV